MYYSDTIGGPMKEMDVKDIPPYDPGPMTREQLSIAMQLTYLQHGGGRVPMEMAMRDYANGLDPLRNFHPEAARQYKEWCDKEKT